VERKQDEQVLGATKKKKGLRPPPDIEDVVKVEREKCVDFIPTLSLLTNAPLKRRAALSAMQ
jgi:hypothetical protein